MKKATLPEPKCQFRKLHKYIRDGVICIKLHILFAVKYFREERHWADELKSKQGAEGAGQ
jgi:hypothetical protein